MLRLEAVAKRFICKVIQGTLVTQREANFTKTKELVDTTFIHESSPTELP
jgi:hypothetical protein